MVDDIDDPGAPSGPSLIPGIAATGVGVVGVVVGFVGHSRLSTLKEEEEQLIEFEDGTAKGLVEDDLQPRANEIRSDMKTDNTMRIFGWAGGGIGLAAGGFLLFRAITAEPVADDGFAAKNDRSFDVDLGVTQDGVNAGFRLRF